MRIRTKASIILLTSVAMVGVSLLAISRNVLEAGYVSLEERQALQGMARVRKALAGRTEALGRTAHDWARWDDTLRFIGGANPGFVAENLEEESLAALDVDLMLFVSRDGRIVHEKVRARPGAAVPAGAVAALRGFTVGSPPAARDGPSLTHAGVMASRGEPVLFAVHPVYHSDGSGPSAGWFCIARFLDVARLEALAADVGLSLSIVPAGTEAAGSADAVRAIDGERIVTRGVFRDPAGAPAFTVEIRSDRETYRWGRRTVRTFVSLMAGVGLGVVAVSLLALHRGVISRVESLDEQVRRIAGGKASTPAVAMAGGDEISGLAGSINEMLRSLARADESLVRSERLAAVGTLAGGVAHQFNNLNAGLLGYADLLLLRPGLDEKTRGYLEQIVKGVQRSAAVTRGLLAFSGEVQQAPVPCRLDEVAAEALPLLESDLAREGISIETRLAEVPPAPMDPALIMQVALSLLLNAVHAVLGRPERRIVVETGVVGPEVYLAVRDTGCGIGAEYRPRLFTPFFTTKGEHARPGSIQGRVKGTGLGLSVSHAIVSRHGGRIEVDSAEGVGSTFTVLLPLRGPAEPLGPLADHHQD